MNGSPRELENVQRWMQSVIMHPDGIVAGIDSSAAREQIDVPSADVEQVITRSQALNSIQRLEIYGNAYYARLLECLQAEFPALRHSVGDETFNGFAFGYLQAYPSRSYTLHKLAAHFPQYLAETRPVPESNANGPDWADFLIDLATLERHYSEVFDGPGVEGEQLLETDDLLAVPPEKWPAARLKPVECLRLVSFRFPVHEYATAVRHNRGAEQLAIPEPAETFLALTRRDFVVRRFPLTKVQYELLGALVAGKTVSEAIRHAVDGTNFEMDELATNIQQWFRNWSANQLFRAVELSATD